MKSLSNKQARTISRKRKFRLDIHCSVATQSQNNVNYNLCADKKKHSLKLLLWYLFEAGNLYHSILAINFDLHD